MHRMAVDAVAQRVDHADDWGFITGCPYCSALSEKAMRGSLVAPSQGLV